MGHMSVQVVAHLVTWFASFADKAPKADDVVAGWGAFAIFVGLIVAVVLLSISLTRHLKKVQRNEERGDVYDASEKKPRRTSL